MNYISKNLKYLRRQHGLTQEQMADKLEIKRPSIGAYEEGRADPPLVVLSKLASIFHISIDMLLHKDLAVNNTSAPALAHQDLKILAITVDNQDRENIELIPQKASAGYLNGYSDPEYIQELPKFRLPMLPTGTYRAFEISGDSMLPLIPGTIIIGQYVESPREIKNGKTYVLVTSTEGIVYKRVFNYIHDNGRLFLVSDNKNYAPYDIAPENLLEIWEAKAFIGLQFPDPMSKEELSLDKIASLLGEIHQEVVKLKEK